MGAEPRVRESRHLPLVIALQRAELPRERNEQRVVRAHQRPDQGALIASEAGGGHACGDEEGVFALEKAW